MNPQEMRARTKQFGSRAIRLFQHLPEKRLPQTLGLQLLRSATSVAANYRAACQARSKAEFIAKIGVALEEADESVLWLEYMSDAGIVHPDRLKDFIREANEITAILAASKKTARAGTGKNSPITRSSIAQ